MSMKLSHIFLAILIYASICKSTSPVIHGFTVPANTSVPFTYCIWYLPDPDKKSFLEKLKASPPNLFHVGYHIPFKGALGPTYGHELYTNDILLSHEIPREIERIQGIIQNLRSAGVNRLIPYVYTMAFFGRPDERSGFFKFYDHWDEYREFGLGPKPSADPALWSQVRGPMQLGGGPQGILHYEPCINHPAWSEYLDLVVRELAAVGYDGMFFDVNTLYCYCPHCQEKFDVYLLKKYGRDGLNRIFGTDDHRILNIPAIYRDFENIILKAFRPYLAKKWTRKNLNRILGLNDTSKVKLENDWRLLRCFMQNSLAEFPPVNHFEEYLTQRFGSNQIDKISTEKKEIFQQTVLRHYFYKFLGSEELASLLKNRFGSTDIKRRCCSNPQDMLLWVETQRFWCQSMAELFARLKCQGRITYARQGRSDDFYTVANLGSMATLDGLNKRRVDAIDLVHWSPMADMQMFEEMNQVGSLESGVIISNIFAFKWAMAAGTRAGTLLYKVQDNRAADLANAEVAAGGGGAFIQAGLAAPESRKRWKEFFTEHADLWDGGNSLTRVGVLFWSDQLFYENTEHLAATRALVHILSETQVPFDIITEENIQSLKQYNVIFAPQLRYLDQTQIVSLLEYAKKGGNLIIIEPFGTEDKYANPRDSKTLENVLSNDEPSQLVKHGRGKIVWYKPESVPKRQSDLWCLMEERANAFGLARSFLNNARQREFESGVDLGPEFICHLEESLQLKLRWCPIETDAGVYIHAYEIPAKHGCSERLIIHAVNYRVPILFMKEAGKNGDPIWSTRTKAGEPIIARNLQINVPMLLDKKVTKVEALSPVDDAQEVKWTTKGDELLLTIERLEIYQAIVLEFE